MDTFTPYDFEPWYQKRRLLWKAMQFPGNGAKMIDAWADHAQLHKLMQNADKFALDIVKEETNCRRLHKATAEWTDMINRFEETTKMLEDWTLIYRLTYQH